MNFHERVTSPPVSEVNKESSSPVQASLDTISDIIMMVRTHRPELTNRSNDFEMLVQRAVDEYLDVSTDTPIDQDRLQEVVAKIEHLEDELTMFAETAGLKVEEVDDEPETETDKIGDRLQSTQAALEARLVSIKRYEYGPAGELIHEPLPEEKNLLQKGRSLSGQLRIVQNQLARVRSGVAHVKEEALIARAALLEQSVLDLLADSAPTGEHASEPLVLDDRYRVVVDEDIDTVPVEEPVVLSEPLPASAVAEQVDRVSVPRIENLYQVERRELVEEVKQLLAREILPEPVASMLRTIETEMLTRLSILSIRDEQYMPLRDRIKETLNQAKSLLEQPEPVAVPKIEGTPNRYLAPHFEKLQSNHRFKAALLVALLSSLTPGKVSEVEYVEAGLGVSQPRAALSIGDHAAWGTASPVVPEVITTKLTVKEVVDDVPPEVPKIIVEPPIPRVIDAVAAEEILIPDEVAPVPLLDTPTVEVIQADSLSALERKAPAVAEVLPDRYTTEVVEGNVDTFPDNQLERFFATIDTKNLPRSLVKRLQAETKLNFYHDVTALKKAGVTSGEASVVLAGEKINYEQPVEAYKEAVSSALKLIAAPHTKVVEAGSDITTAVLESYERDLAVVSAGERAVVIAKALAAYSSAVSNAAEAMGVSSFDVVEEGSLVDLRPLAPYLATAVAEQVRRVVDTDSVAVSADTSDDMVSTAEVDPVGTPLTPETYPGGALAFSRDYQTFVASLGINGVRSSWFDAMFAPAGPTSQALLGETVGDLTKLMISQSPAERAEILTVLGVTESAAKRVYDVIVAERAAGRLSASLDNDTTIETVLKHVVLQSAAQVV